ncbi:hypothetical protein [Nocardia donostiensis]|nr:hypothetical protein [Nocardia donostiensis]
MHHPPPPQIPVVVAASAPITPRSRPLPMMVEFAPGLRFLLHPGNNQLFLPPGRYRAQLWSQYTFWRVGRAELDIDTTRGPVWLSYTTPRTIYGAGVAGFHPQARRGLW